MAVRHEGPITDEQRKAIRMALTGQDTEPVELETHGTHDTGAGGEVVSDPVNDTFMVDVADVARELAAHDPVLFELMASRAALKRLTATANGNGEQE